MIAFLKGVLNAKTATTAFVEVNGVGFAVGMSQAGLSKLPEAGASVQIHTYLQVRDDALALYGFLSLEEKALFEQLISVGGVGPKVALAALSAFTPRGLAAAIASQDVAAVQKIPGVGKKTASRIILELKGSLDQGVEGLFDDASPASSSDAGLQGAHEALLSMGFTSEEADVARSGRSEGAASVLLQYALKRLGTN
ncbi:MAG: Holliday junction branch migration protein RuvA [Eggerthellaceae bacterium]